MSDLRSRLFPATVRVLTGARRRRGWLLGSVFALLCGAALVSSHAQGRADPESPSNQCGGAPAHVSQDRSTFLGHPCGDDDCAAHKAGFAWADHHGVADLRDCADVEDPGFAEGCRVFVVETVTAEQAGFQWARENEVADACRCGGAGPRFEAGCAAYVAVIG